MKKQTLSGLLLIGSLMSPGLAGAFDQVQDVSAENSLNSIYNLMNGDYTRKQLAYALINYEAAARMNEYQYNQKLLFMVAPGSAWAIEAGNLVGKANIESQALQLSNSAVVNMFGLFSTSPTVSFMGSNIDLTATRSNASSGASGLWPSIDPYFKNGDLTSLAPFNPGMFLQTNNLPKSNVTPAQSQQMINLLTNPFPYATLDPGLVSKLQTPLPPGTDPDVYFKASEKDAIVNQMVENAMYSLSTSALADIVARRTPSDSSQPSVMDAMTKYSQARIADPDWYASIGTASEAALLRELVHMQAYNSWMQFQQFRVAEQQMALLAAMNSILGNVNVALTTLNQQMQAAAAAVKNAPPPNITVTNPTPAQ